MSCDIGGDRGGDRGGARGKIEPKMADGMPITSLELHPRIYSATKKGK